MIGPKRLSLTVASESEYIGDALRSIEGIKRVTVVRSEDGNVQYELLLEPSADVRRDIFFSMASNSWPIVEMRSNEPSLEDVYLGVTSLAERKGGSK
jgi:ABC-2 type transport system ATP-binding protein